MSPRIMIDPAMKSGQPTINGTRLTVDAVVNMAWVEGVDVAADQYEITRADVLVCCWYAGTYGLPGARRLLFPVRLWRKRWGDWADAVGMILWAAHRCDYGAVPDPPTATEGRGHSTHTAVGSPDSPARDQGA